MELEIHSLKIVKLKKLMNILKLYLKIPFFNTIWPEYKIWFWSSYFTSVKKTEKEKHKGKISLKIFGKLNNVYKK